MGSLTRTTIDKARDLVPERVFQAGKRVAKQTVLRPAVKRRWRPIRWGNTDRDAPISANWGVDRGLPVDRRFIEQFLVDHRTLIAGRVLEVGYDLYASRFGHPTAVDVVDISPTNPFATIVSDLAEPGSLPASTFDCAIVLQTLQYLDDMDAAVANLWASLRPGGAMLISAPTASGSKPEYRASDAWRIMPRGLEILVERNCPGANAEVWGVGNLRTVQAFLLGAAVEDLPTAAFERYDPDHPLLALAVVRRAPVTP